MNDDHYETLEVLLDVLDHACMSGQDIYTLDSKQISAYADGLRLLAKYGFVETVFDNNGDRVVATRSYSYNSLETRAEPHDKPEEFEV